MSREISDNPEKSIAELLKHGLNELSLAFSEKQLRQLEQYYQELSLWNSSLRLVGAEGEAVIRNHMFDALAPLPELIRRIPRMTDEGFSCADFGSGSGLPGIPLAVMLPACRMTLIERSGRRAGFLRNCIVMTELSERTSLWEGDIRQLKLNRNVTELRNHLEESGGGFDAVVSRAVMSIADTYRLAEPLLRDNGVMIFYKGMKERAEEELESFAKSDTVLSGQVKHELFPVYNPLNPSRERTAAVIRKLFHLGN